MGVGQVGQLAGTSRSDRAGLHPDDARVHTSEGVGHDLGDGVAVTQHGDHDGCAGDGLSHRVDGGHTGGPVRRRPRPFRTPVPQSDLMAGLAQAYRHGRAEGPRSEDGNCRV